MSGKPPGRARSLLTACIAVKATRVSDGPQKTLLQTAVEEELALNLGSDTLGTGWRERCEGQRNLLRPMQMGWRGANGRGLCPSAGELPAPSSH